MISKKLYCCPKGFVIDVYVKHNEFCFSKHFTRKKLIQNCLYYG